MYETSQQLTLVNCEGGKQSPSSEFWSGDKVLLRGYGPCIFEVLSTEDSAVRVRSVDTGVERSVPYWVVSKCSCVPPKTATHEHTHEHWVQTYYVTRCGKKHEYFRYCYLLRRGDISSCVRVHIPGGNTDSATSQIRKLQIEAKIASGVSPSAIAALIKSWKPITPASS